MSRPRLIALLLALATLVVYLPVRTHGFVDYDDDDYVTANAFVKNGLTWTDIKWAFTTFHAANWHPLTWISHMTDCELFGLNPGPHHFVSVLFHAANVVLLFMLLLRLTDLRAEKGNGTSSRQADVLWPCAFIAALFAWHPLHVESVAWIAERKDVLSTFFGLLALLAYTKFAQENSRRNFWLALIYFALGLMSKPMLVTLPFVLLLLDYWPLQRFTNFKLQTSTIWHLIWEKWPFFLLTAISCAVTFAAQHNGNAVSPLEKVSLRYRLVNATVALGHYVLKILWPVNLAVFYPLPRGNSPFVFAAALVGLIFISVVVWLARKRSPYLLVGWLWFVGTLVPVIGLVQVGGAAMADRYTYIPSIGIFIAAAFGARALANHFQFPNFILPPICVLILGACLVLTEKQLSYWRDSESLFRHAMAVTNDNDIALINLGVALEQQDRLNEALVEYLAAEKLASEHYQVHNNLGNVLDRLGRPAEALVEYRTAISLDPDIPFLHNSLGQTLVELGRDAEAMDEFSLAVRLDPNYQWPHFNIGNQFLKQGRDAEAIDQFRTAMRLDPENFQILTRVAHVLAADKNSQIRDGKTALLLAAKANILTGGQQPLVLDALGMACAETGDFTNAVEVTQRALDLANAAKMKKLDPLQQRLELYRNHQPWRESFLATNAPAKNLPAK